MDALLVLIATETHALAVRMAVQGAQDQMPAQAASQT